VEPDGPPHVDVTQVGARSRIEYTLRLRKVGDQVLSTLRSILEVIGICGIPGLQFGWYSLRSRITGWFEAETEWLVILERGNVRPIDHVINGRVTRDVLGDGGLVAAKSNPRATNMERCWHKLKLYLLYFDPVIVRGCSNDYI
jgi:hypothetical protein